jgi:hypothetical protein
MMGMMIKERRKIEHLKKKEFVFKHPNKKAMMNKF